MTTPLLITSNGKERKTNISDIKPCSTTELLEDTWDSFPKSLQTKCQNGNYNLVPQPSFKV